MSLELGRPSEAYLQSVAPGGDERLQSAQINAPARLCPHLQVFGASENRLPQASHGLRSDGTFCVLSANTCACRITPPAASSVASALTLARARQARSLFMSNRFSRVYCWLCPIVESFVAWPSTMPGQLFLSEGFATMGVAPAETDMFLITFRLAWSQFQSVPDRSAFPTAAVRFPEACSRSSKPLVMNERSRVATASSMLAFEGSEANMI